MQLFVDMMMMMMMMMIIIIIIIIIITIMSYVFHLMMYFCFRTSQYRVISNDLSY